METTAHTRVSRDELQRELQPVLSLHFGAPRQIRSLRRRRSTYSSSYTIENLELELDHGRNLSLVFKDLSPASILEKAQEVRPRFLYRPQREIETYRAILNGERFGTPICYGAVERPGLERYWLFLERVEGPLLWQAGRIETWKRAARWIARLHSRFGLSNGGQTMAWPISLLRYDAEHLRCWAARAEHFLARRCGSIRADTHRRFRRLVDKYDVVVDRLLSLPRAFMHGEFYPSNVILRGNGHGKRVCPIDWEGAAIGPGLIDLAALSSGNWTAEERKMLVAAYREAVEPGHGWPPSLKEMLELVD
jgi:aminoglycoside phosphotransferase (APT) family kinase protein